MERFDSRRAAKSAVENCPGVHCDNASTIRMKSIAPSRRYGEVMRLSDPLLETWTNNVRFLLVFIGFDLIADGSVPMSAFGPFSSAHGCRPDVFGVALGR
jgi:hypothetical protein